MSRSRRHYFILGLMGLTTLAVGVIVWGVQRRQTYQVLTEFHLGEMAKFETLEKSEGYRANLHEGKVPGNPMLAFLAPVPSTAPIRASEALNAKRAAYHTELYLKYKKAAEQPWIAVEPDPSGP